MSSPPDVPSAALAAHPRAIAIAAARRVSWLEQVRIILFKDLTIEARSGEVVVNSAFFALLVVVISSLAFYVSLNTRAQVAAGSIWLSTAFAAVLSLSRTGLWSSFSLNVAG